MMLDRFNDREYRALIAFMDTIKSYLGKPYRWGGDDPSGFDCSGLVLEGLKAAGKIKENVDMTADGIWHFYNTRRTSEPRAGCLGFVFKNGKAVHVVVCLDRYFYIGADGGGRHIKTEEDAWRHNAFIKIRPISNLVDPLFVNPWG